MESNESVTQPTVRAPKALVDVAAPYGYCPVCGKPGHDRERRPDGNDTCLSGHKYPSSTALHAPLQPGQTQPETDGALRLENERLKKQIHDQHIANGQLQQQLKASAAEIAKLKKQVAELTAPAPATEGGKK